MKEEPVDIVIVEDNASDAELITRALKKGNLGNRIVLLKDGAEALGFFFGEDEDLYRALGGHPRLILLDLKLPKVNGIEVLRKLKEDPRTKEIPVVVLTSSQEAADLKAAYEAGTNSYLTKPIVFGEFAKVMGELESYWLQLNKAPSG